MTGLITGGSGSGKSEYAERLAAGTEWKRRIYVATMIPWDEECRRRIARHQRQRNERNFETAECFRDLETLRLPGRRGEASVLLECLSNLTANEIYRTDLAENTPQKAMERIWRGICSLREQAGSLIIVTNEVFSDGEVYDRETGQYLEVLGALNRRLAKTADLVVEVVYGIPVVMKKETDR